MKKSDGMSLLETMISVFLVTIMLLGLNAIEAQGRYQNQKILQESIQDQEKQNGYEREKMGVVGVVV